MELNDELQLIDQAKIDLRAFDQLYNMYYNKIFAFVFNRLASREAAEDITSLTFLAAIENLHKFDTTKKLRLSAWLYKIASNKIIDFFRKKKMTPLDNYEAMIGEDDQSLMHNVEIDEYKVEVASILSTLHPRYQAVITMKFFTEMTNEEIAAALEISPANTAVILHRALKSFKSSYEKIDPEGEIYQLS